MKYCEPCEKCWCGASACVIDHKNFLNNNDGFIVKCKRRHFGAWSGTIDGAIASWSDIIQKRRIRIEKFQTYTGKSYIYGKRH